MARYIDANLLMEDVENNTPLNWTDSESEIQEQFDYQTFKHIIEKQPTADVVEVVRCEKCKYYKQNPWNKEEKEMLCMCWGDWLPTEPEDFCSSGEAKGE